MITHSKQILTGLLSILIIAPGTSLNARWDWKDVAAAGAIAAGVGACVYVATRPENPSSVRREAENYYQSVYQSNKQLLDLYRTEKYSDKRTAEELIYLVTKKGQNYYTDKWFLSNSDYLSNECKQHAPLLRGYAALLDESSKLLDLQQRLIACCGSLYGARHEYYNFDNLQKLADALRDIAHTIERKKVFMVTRDNFAMYRSQMEELARQEANLRQLKLQRTRLHNNRTRLHNRLIEFDTFCDEDDDIWHMPKSHCQFMMNLYN